MRRLHKFSALAVLFLYLIGCGGGSGGGDGSDGIKYTGKTTPAIIDDTNAEVLAESAISGASTGSAFVVAKGQEAQPAPTILDVARILSNSLTQINILLPSSDVAARIVNITDDLPCSGGGRIRVNMDIDDITLDFTGNFNFIDCVEGDTTMNGSTGVNGTFTGSGFSPLNFNFNPMTVDSGTESYTMSGTVRTSFSGSTATITMNVRSRNNNTQLVDWINNVTITAIDRFSYVEMTITGRFYHPEHGYIDIETINPLRINNFDQYPSTGQIIITGDSGSKARLTATSNTEYSLEVDPEGDGTYEAPTTENWG